MQSPSTTIGELEVKKPGWPNPSTFRQIFSPSEALTQERVPCTPIVTTFPSVTVGELLAPANDEAAPDALAASYSFFQSSFPPSRRRPWRVPARSASYSFFQSSFPLSAS